MYNNERFDLAAKHGDLVVKESIVHGFKINPARGPLTFKSKLTQALVEEKQHLIFPKQHDSFEFTHGPIVPAEDPTQTAYLRGTI